MPGTGFYPAGFTPAGWNPPTTPGERFFPSVPLALHFDPETRGFVFNSDGTLQAVHPVDQAVELALGIQLGFVASEAEFGFDLSKIRKASSATMQSTVNDAVKLALSLLIRNGDIELLGSPVEFNRGGRIRFFVDYINLRLQSPTITRVTVA